MRARTDTVLLGVVFAATAVDAAVQMPAAPASENLVRPIGLLDWLFGNSQPPSRARPREEEGDAPSAQPRRQPQGTPATYRTLCVRLCDGFYFPISFATPRSKFGDDAERCERQCPGQSRFEAFERLTLADRMLSSLQDAEAKRGIHVASLDTLARCPLPKPAPTFFFHETAATARDCSHAESSKPNPLERAAVMWAHSDCKARVHSHQRRSISCRSTMASR
jgi:hypothetical protein